MARYGETREPKHTNNGQTKLGLFKKGKWDRAGRHVVTQTGFEILDNRWDELLLQKRNCLQSHPSIILIMITFFLCCSH